MKLSSLSLPIAITFSGCLPQPPKEPDVIVSQQVAPVSPKMHEQDYIKSKTLKRSVDPKKAELKSLFNEQNEIFARIGQAAPGIAKLECMTSQQTCMEEQTKLYFNVVPLEVLQKCPEYSNNKNTCVDDEMVKRGKIDELIEVYKIGNRCLAEIERCIREK